MSKLNLLLLVSDPLDLEQAMGGKNIKGSRLKRGSKWKTQRGGGTRDGSNGEGGS